MSGFILQLGEHIKQNNVLQTTLSLLHEKQEHVVSKLEDITPELVRNASLILIDQPESLDVIRLIAEKITSKFAYKTVLFADIKFPEDFHYLFNQAHLFQIFPTHLLNEPDLIRALLSHVLEKRCTVTGLWLEDKTEIVSLSLKARSEKSVLLNKMGNILTDLSVPKRQVQQIQTVSDELIMNALFNAPTDLNGLPINRSLARNTGVVLENHQTVTVQFGRNDHRVFLSVKDPFGSLSLTNLKNSLLRALNKGDGQLRKGDRGAGIGIYSAWSMMSHLHVDLIPRAYTQIVGLFPLVQRNSDPMRTIKGFSVIKSEK